MKGNPEYPEPKMQSIVMSTVKGAFSAMGAFIISPFYLLDTFITVADLLTIDGLLWEILRQMIIHVHRLDDRSERPVLKTNAWWWTKRNPAPGYLKIGFLELSHLADVIEIAAVMSVCVVGFRCFKLWRALDKLLSEEHKNASAPNLKRTRGLKDLKNVRLGRRCERTHPDFYSYYYANCL